MQDEEFIALLKSTVKENRFDIIPDNDLIEICKRARKINDSINIMDIELSETIFTLLEEIKKRGLPQVSNPNIDKEKKTTLKKVVNLKYEAKKSAILIGLGVLSNVFSFFLSVFNKPTPGKLDLLTSSIVMMIRGAFDLLGFCLILVGIVFGLRAIVYKKWKPSSISKSNEPVVFIENKKHSNKKKILKWACYVSVYCLVVSLLVKVIRIFFGAGDDSIAPLAGWMLLMSLAILLSLVAALCGLIFGIFVICKSVFGISENDENKQEESTALTVLSILSCFVPISVLLLFFYVTVFLRK